MIGIVAATQGEVDELIDLLGANKLCDTPFVTYGFQRGVIVLSGMGPENAARATEHLVDRYAPEMILNPGICLIHSMPRASVPMADHSGNTFRNSNTPPVNMRAVIST